MDRGRGGTRFKAGKAALTLGDEFVLSRTDGSPPNLSRLPLNHTMPIFGNSDSDVALVGAPHQSPMAADLNVDIPPLDTPVLKAHLQSIPDPVSFLRNPPQHTTSASFDTDSTGATQKISTDVFTAPDVPVVHDIAAAITNPAVGVQGTELFALHSPNSLQSAFLSHLSPALLSHLHLSSDATSAPLHIADQTTANADGNSTPVDPELWITAFSGSDENLLIHADDTGTHVATNTGSLYTPDSSNFPAYNSEARVFAFDTQDNVYVVVSENARADPSKILVGSLSAVLANPTGTPALTTVFSDTSATDGSGNPNGSGWAIDGLALDPDNSEIYFVDHQSLEKVSYSGTGLTVLGSVTSLIDGTAHVFMDGLALDLPGHVAYFTSDTTFSTSTSHGAPTSTVNSNAIYKSSNLTTSSGSNSITFSKLVDVPVSDGVVSSGTGVQGITVDTVNGLIYFTTQHVTQLHVTSNAGVYAYNPTSGTVNGIAAGSFKTIWLQGSGGGPTGNLESIHVDDATGNYYVTVNGSGTNDAIYVGSLSANGSTAPTLFLQIPSYTHGGQPIASDFAIDNAPTLSSVTGAGNYALQGGSQVLTLSAVGTDADTDNDKGDGAAIAITNAQSGDVLEISGAQSGTSSGITYSFNSTTHTMTLFGTATFAQYEALIDQIQFQDTGTDVTSSSHPTRAITYQVYDGLLNSDVTGATTVTQLIDRAPNAAAFAPATVAQDAASTANAGAGLKSNGDLDGDSLSISVFQNHSGTPGTFGNVLNGDYGQLTLNADGSYSYVANNDAGLLAAPFGSHPVDHFTFTLDDGLGGTTDGTLDFTIDRPGIAHADSISTNETSTVTASTNATGLLGNDVDPDTNNNTGLSVIAVNGSGANVGNQITFADGSFVTVHADGTYTYDPNHAFDYLPSATSGASDTTGTESFTYTITGGSTQTVTVTIHGQDSNDVLLGTTGNDTIHGGVGDDVFFDDNGQFPSGGTVGGNLSAVTGVPDGSASTSGGADSLFGDSGNDTFIMGANLTAATKIDGGTNSDTVDLNGDYSGAHALVMNATTMVNVETLAVEAGYSYDLTTNDATVASGHTLTVDGSTLGAGDTLTFNGAAETDGSFDILGGAGNDTLTGGQFGDLFELEAGGNDTVHGGSGPNEIDMGGSLTAADSIDGGSNALSNVMVLDGDYTGAQAVVFGPTTVVDVGAIELAPGNSYDLTSNDATVAAGQTMIVDGEFLGASDSLHFDGSAETDGSFLLIDGLGNDVLKGGAGDDFLSFDGGGTDTGMGGAGDDFFDACGHLDATDQFDGGSGYDIVELTADETSTGNYTGVNAIHLTPSMLANFEEIDLDSGGSYDITTVDATVAAGVTFTVDASQLGAGETLTFDGSAETDGNFYIIGGAGDDVLIGGSQHNLFHLDQGGNDTATGGSADDGFYFGAAFTAADTVDGGGGTNNQIGLEGDYTGVNALVLGPDTITNIQVIAMLPGFSYDLTTVDANVAANQNLTIWAAHLAASNTLTFDGAAESDGSFTVFGGAGNDSITGGSGADTLWGLGGADTITGGAGADHFVYNAVSDSTGDANGTAYDTITDFDAAADKFDLPVAVTGVDTAIVLGTLDSGAGTFDTELAAAVNLTNLAAHHAVLFTPNLGTLAGHTFLIVDANGTAGYQAGQDFVFDVTGGNLASLHTADFI